MTAIKVGIDITVYMVIKSSNKRDLKHTPLPIVPIHVLPWDSGQTPLQKTN